MIGAGSRFVWILVTLVAVSAGLYGRFKGLGTWPLGVDEFYISRSIDHVLTSGLPAFPCGGYYTRGLIYQYVVAALRSVGWSPEFAGRWVAAVAGLGVLPAMYLIGKRVHGAFAGWLVIVMLCLSIWEIEMARFARMYAPFQAVFAWYVWSYLRYTVDKRSGALWEMMALSLVGVLIWEGGVLLGLANIFAVVATTDRSVLKLKDGAKLAGRLAMLAALLVVLYLATRDLRIFADSPAEAAMAPETISRFAPVLAWFAPLTVHPVWALGLLPVLLLAGRAARRLIVTGGSRWLVGGLCGVLAVAVLHAFLLAAALLVLLLLLRIVEPARLGWRHAAEFWGALGAALVFWLAVDVATVTASMAGVLSVLHAAVGFPDVYDHVALPWARTVPVLTLGLSAACAALVGRSIRSGRTQPDAVDLLLSLVIVLVLAVGATPTERIETRYTFFLYPLLLLLAVHALLTLVDWFSASRGRAVWAAGLLPLACFGASEDFQPGHLMAVDSAAVNYRVGMRAHWVEHYYPRSDIRGVAEWLDTHVQPGDLVVTGIPTLDQYYHKIDYFYLDAEDNRYEAYVCPDGRTERWTNRPVLYTETALRPLIAAGHRIFATVYGPTEMHLGAAAAAAGWSMARVWTAPSRTAGIVLIQRRPDAGEKP